MCGISFIYSESKSSEEQQEKVKASLGAMEHRGPDDSGFWQSEGVAIGHRRLSIIDISGSKQPLTGMDGRFVLTYNGEFIIIRNYEQDLKTTGLFRPMVILKCSWQV